MCTLSWRKTPDSVCLWFNRDEQRARPRALPPAHSTEFLAPIDPQGGGTWITVNRHGLASALMNHYAADAATPPDPVSRGQLMLSLATCSSLSELGSTLRTQLSTVAYAPCFVWAVTIHEDAQLWSWNGTGEPEPFRTTIPMHTTSAYRPPEAFAYRRERFHELVSDPEHPTEAELERFHRFQDPENLSFSPDMERADAKTVSHTRIQITDRQAEMTYMEKEENAVTCRMVIPPGEDI